MEITPQGFERASDKLTPEQLDRSVDEVVVEAPTESVPETPVEIVPEPAAEAPAEAEAEAAASPEEEEKVPKSRFLTVHQRAIEAEKKIRQLEADYASKPETKTPAADDADLRKYYVETFGESDATERLYQAELARFSSIEERAAERAFERFSRIGKEQEEAISQRVASFDAAFEELAVVEGKEFTDDEQVALLDIVEEYSPKDAQGQLIADYLLPLDKAYDIYKVKNAPVIAAKKTERNAVASLSGARSEGAPSASADTDWQPGRERRWWDKVK